MITDQRLVIYPDLEFNPDDSGVGGTLALGIVDSNDREFYRINYNANLYALQSSPAYPFLSEHVLPNLPIHHDHLQWDRNHPDYQFVKPAHEIAADLADWLAPHEQRGVRMVGYFGTGDLARIHDLWCNNWRVMPKTIPRTFSDLSEWATVLGIELPGVDEGAGQPHHALSDARHHRTQHRSLIGKTVTIQ